MNTRPLQHGKDTHLRVACVNTSLTCLPIGLERCHGSSWLFVLALLMVLPDRNPAAGVENRSRPIQTQRGSALQQSWVAWHVVPPGPASDTQANLPEPNSGESVPPAVASDGLRPLGQLTVDIRPKPGEIPPDVAAVKFAQAGRIAHPIGTSRPWNLSTVCWASPAFCHRPLYFEEVNLERYGYSYGVVQPAVSAAHFFGRIPALPYLMTAERPCDCVYRLGHYTPGSCAPYHTYSPPPSLKAGLVEAAVMTGLIFVLP